MDKFRKRVNKLFGDRRRGEQDDAEGGGIQRRIFVNLPLPKEDLDEYGEPAQKYSTNKIRTSKYTLYSFVPKNLFEQFRRVANLYFLILVILQLFSIFGATNPGLAAFPLAFIIVVTGAKDGYEDWRRYSLDKTLNGSETQVLGGKYKNPNATATTARKWWHVLCFAPRRVKKVAKGRKHEGDFDPTATALSDSDTTAAYRLDKISSKREILEKEALENAPLGTQGEGAVIQPSSPSANGHGLDDLSDETARSQSPRGTSTVIDHSHKISGKTKWKTQTWQNLHVGDVVKIHDDEPIPADIAILATSEADGLCYLETKSLDGETNLKVRRALNATNAIETEKDVEQANFMIESEGPHANLYSYFGVLRWSENHQDHPALADADTRAEPISINSLLLRGSVLRNTEWVIGVVVFTGPDTKIMMNSGDTPSKRSRIERETNFHVSMNFIILFLLCTACAVADGVYFNYSATTADLFDYGNEAPTAAADAIVTFWSCLILFQNIVPISLYISIEIVKTIQAYFIYQDVDMYYEPIDYPCTPKTWNISDDLGQIEYVFSDKTGTLTQNVMEFKKCTINGVPYGHAVTEAMIGKAMREGNQESFDMNRKSVDHLADERMRMLEQMSDIFDNKYANDPESLTFVDAKLFEDIRAGEVQSKHIVDFFRALALCHTALVDRPDPEDENFIDYKAQSPDEAALVATARDVGCAFLERNNDMLKLNVMGKELEYKLLNVLEFTSARKRMSVIVRPSEGRIMLICKGADSVIYERLVPNEQKDLQDHTTRDLENFANEGLRTLCISYKYLAESEYEEWAKEFAVASSALSDRDDKVEAVCEKIENNLVLLGGTAIEDRLQDGVPEAIAHLGRAGIKLWVLTGDKVETATNIAFSCNLLRRNMILMVIQGRSAEAVEKQIDDSMASFFSDDVSSEYQGKQHALIIDGDALKFGLEEPIKEKLLQLGERCASVICCRVSPSQKAKVVLMVKDGRDTMTLAIGDGANDVAMIQEANVGVGISGKEGSQAVMSSDYAIGQFRFLAKLLLVHGRWSYIRISEMIVCFFYKNIVWTIAMFWYQFFCGFDGQYLFDYTYITLYNLAFTSLPVIILGAFDQDLNAKVSMAVPQLYKRGIDRKEFTRKRFWFYVVDGFYQSAVCFFLPYLMYYDGGENSHTGRENNSLTEFGTVVAASAIVVVNLYVGLNTLYWSWITILINSISTLFFFLWVAIYSAFNVFFFRGTATTMFSSFNFWLTIIITTFICLIPRFIVQYVRKNLYPTNNDIIREQYKRGMFSFEDYENVGALEEDHEKDEKPRKSMESRSKRRSLYLAAAKRRSQRGSEMTTAGELAQLSPPLVSFATPNRNAPVGFSPLHVSERPQSMIRPHVVGMDGNTLRLTGFAFSSDDRNVNETFRRSVYRPIVQKGAAMKRPFAGLPHTLSDSKVPTLGSFGLERTQSVPSGLDQPTPPKKTKSKLSEDPTTLAQLVGSSTAVAAGPVSGDISSPISPVEEEYVRRRTLPGHVSVRLGDLPFTADRVHPDETNSETDGPRPLSIHDQQLISREMFSGFDGTGSATDTSGVSTPLEVLNSDAGPLQASNSIRRNVRLQQSGSRRRGSVRGEAGSPEDAISIDSGHSGTSRPLSSHLQEHSDDVVEMTVVV